MTKKINSAGDNWISYWKALGATKYHVLNDTDAVGTNTAAWNDTEPTSSVISLGNATTTNGNTDTFICYAFAEKKDIASLVHIQEMEMLMVHSFIQDLNQLL